MMEAEAEAPSTDPGAGVRHTAKREREDAGPSQPSAPPSKRAPPRGAGKGEEQEQEQDGSDYSSSSDEEPGNNDAPDPLYDPDADDDDVAWASKQRGGRSSDAILSCPCCFTTLCIDCQAHEQQANQYRAMFVRACTVDRAGAATATATAPASSQGRHRRSKRSKAGGAGGRSEQTFPVRCEVCSELVGVQDADEVYHFTNVFPSCS